MADRVTKRDLLDEIQRLRNIISTYERKSQTTIVSLEVHSPAESSDGHPRVRFVLTAPTMKDEGEFGKFVARMFIKGWKQLGVHAELAEKDKETR